MRLVRPSDLGARRAEHADRTRPDPLGLRRSVEALARPRSRLAEPTANRATRDAIAQRLSELALDVEIAGRFGNVVARCPAREGPAVLIGAHYDSVPGSPGADDNASALTALLATAEALTATSPEPFVFAAWNAEEEGVIGSAEFVARWLPETGITVAEAHVLEMVGYADHRSGAQRRPRGLPVEIPDRGDFLALVGNRASRGALHRALGVARSTTLPVLGLDVAFGLENLFPVLLRSDHAPFWQRGIPALLWTDTAEVRNPHYHRSSDTPDTLDYAFLSGVTDLLIDVAINAARRLAPAGGVRRHV